MTEFILGLITLRDVNLTGIALVICGNSEVSSAYRRLQRFFAKVEICYECLAKLIVAIAKIDDTKWTLAMDRTNWKFGKLYINILGSVKEIIVTKLTSPQNLETLKMPWLFFQILKKYV